MARENFTAVYALGFLGGIGVDPAKNFRFDAGGGYFQAAAELKQQDSELGHIDDLDGFIDISCRRDGIRMGSQA